MKITLPILLTFFLISTSSILSAQSISLNTAKVIAKNHLLIVSKENLKSASTKQIKFQFSTASSAIENQDTLYYILNDTINNDFVIVSADNRVWPILGYSLDGKYNNENQSPAFVEWMENRKKEIAYIKQNNIQPDSNISQQWQNLSSTNSNNTIATTSVGPLLKTKWDQGCYYNALCPADADGQCGRVWTGCVATAMAQLMQYWNFPTTGTGSYSYMHSTYGNLSADFGSTTYQWSQMPNSVKSKNDAVATLMFHCGVSVNMNYSANSSAAGGPRDALVNYFNYSSKAQNVDKVNYSTDDWVNLMKSELDLRRPIWYRGDNGSSGHAFVCDGYQNTDYFHFNWGWGGYSDGYFYLGDLVDGYNSYQGAVINLLPTSLPDGYGGFFLSDNTLGISANGGSNSVTIASSANWTASSDQSWLTLNAGTGTSGTTSLILTATENNTASARSATVTVSAAGSNSQLISITQTAKVLVTPGELSNVLAGKLATTTYLTLNGTMDARDFKTIRDDMPLLAGLDLSRVTIAAYNGTEGTSIWNNTNYSGNTIPEFAFLTANWMGKTSLTSLILPSNLASIGQYAFGFCSGLASISIPSSVTSIGDGAFYYCTSLVSITVGWIVPINLSTSDNVFLQVNKTVCTLNVPFGSKTDYQAAYQWMDFQNMEEIPGLYISTNSLSFGGTQGIKIFNINSSADFTLVSNQNWLVLNPVSGSMGKNSVTVSVTENKGALRTALISISTAGFSDQTINVSQYSQTLVSAGGLHNALGNNLATTSNLTLSGTIDARDFKTMRDEMPLLAVLDLSHVNIIAYNGSGGTSLWGNTVYLANVVPECAFLTSNWEGKPSLTSVELPASITSISTYAFSACTGLTAFQIPSSVTTIESQVFAYCSGLHSISIPASVSSIGQGAFNYCTGLINVDANNPNYSSLEGVLFNKNQSSLIQCPTSKAGNYTIPSTVIIIEPDAFQACYYLNSVEIPSSVKSIEAYAFWNCYRLNSATIPSSVTSIKAQAFAYCYALTSLTAVWQVPLDLTASADVFAGIDKNACTLNVSFGTKSLYQAANQWQDFTNIVEMPGLNVSATTVSTLADGGISASIDITSNVDWTANSDQTWLTVNPTSGTGNKTLTFTVGANQTFSNRIATVTILAIGLESKTITITQDGIHISQDIALNTGWNIISSNVVPANLDMKVIFQSLIDAGKLKKVMDETGKTVENFGAFGGWKNNIGNMNSGKGYKVNVIAASTLSLEGTPVQLSMDLNLNIGWNIISYPSSTIQDAKALVQSLIDVEKLKKVMDETGKTIENFGAFGGWKNNIGNFVPGKGYKVNVLENCTLTVPATGTKSAVVILELMASEHFKLVFTGNGTDHMSINLIDLQTSGLIAGDEIGVFDGKHCVGSATIGTEQLTEGSISIPASANDELNETANGFIVGHQVALKLFRNTKEYILKTEIVQNDQNIFAKGESMFAKVSFQQTTNLDEFARQTAIKCYPNPFTDQINIEIQLQEPKKLEVRIYDINGKLVRNLYKGKAEKWEKLVWDGRNGSGAKVVPGTYLLKANEQIEKIILKK